MISKFQISNFKFQICPNPRVSQSEILKFGILKFVFLCAFAFPQSIAAQLDTTKVYQIQEIEVAGNKTTIEKSSVPIQQLDTQQLENLNAFQVSDAVKYFAGVSVKDYGGIGGIKTISVRSLGSTHTAVSIDGIPVNDAQTGQIDIGRFSLANVESLSLVSGQSDNIFQPAKLFASASVLNIQSGQPTFEGDKTFNINIGSKFGSFRFFNPFVTYNQKLSEKFALTVDSEWAQTDGNYPFTFENGNYNISEKRHNSDVKKLRAETSLFGRFSDKDNLRLKLYYYQTEQGLPGAVIFENPTASSERIWDKNFSAQAHYQNDFSHLWSLQVNTKHERNRFRYRSNDRYDDENNYNQSEYYLSTSVLFKPLRKLSFSLSCDGFYNSLDADLKNFEYPERYSLLTAISAKYNTRRLSATTSVLTTLVNEEVKTGRGIDEQKLSPFVSFSYQPFVRAKYFSPLRLRFFYKNIFRLPSFNDLYYTNIGNRNLLPENTNQYNIGVTYVVRAKNISPLQITADVYYNNITNKIVAVPRHSVFIWSMENVGKVEIKGLDITAGTKIMYNKKHGIWLQGSYTYQETIDLTPEIDGKKNKAYRHQLAYVPRFSGSGSCTVETPWFDVSYSVIASGRRYGLGQNIAANSLSGYADMGISLKRNFVFSDGKYNLFVQGEILNLLDDNYHIVKWYPMPRRTFRVSVSFGF